MIEDVKVILIGGSPMVGKTTLASQLASKYEYNCISTDDIGEILQTAIDINPMKGLDYRQYYIDKNIDELKKDVDIYHSKIWPAIKRLIEIHSLWSSPIIIEGWALYPKLIHSLQIDGVRKIWLVGDDNLFRERVIAHHSFYEGASNPNLMIDRYIKRTVWHNSRLIQELNETNEYYIKVDQNSSKDHIFEKVVRVFAES